ncbi:hypothetical protein K1I93_09530, partial [Streptococcus australis]|nr:hypothetical protein [Streptococcus australis]
KHDGNDWIEKKKNKSEQCKNIKLYKPKDGQDGTKIEILKSGEGENDIETKLNAFCKTEDDKSLYAAWKCYKHNEVKIVQGQGEEEDEEEEDKDEVKHGGGLCILKKEEQSAKNSSNEPADIQKTFYDFFYYWVAHMLKDSIHWRTEKIKKCLKNEKEKRENKKQMIGFNNTEKKKKKSVYSKEIKYSKLKESEKESYMKQKQIMIEENEKERQKKKL